MLTRLHKLVKRVNKRTNEKIAKCVDKENWPLFTVYKMNRL